MTNHTLGGPSEGNCAVRSFTVLADTADDFRTSDEKDEGTMPWAEFIASIAAQGGTRPTFDLFDVPLPDGTVRRYRAVPEGCTP